MMPAVGPILLLLQALLGLWLLRALTRLSPTGLCRMGLYPGLPALALSAPWALLALRETRLADHPRPEAMVAMLRAGSITLPVFLAIAAIAWSCFASMKTRLSADADGDGANDASSASEPLTGMRLAALAMSTGVVLVLVAAAHRLMTTVGQTMFAIFAIILWMLAADQPADMRPQEKAKHSVPEPLAHGVCLLVMLGSTLVGQTMPGEWLPWWIVLGAVQGTIILGLFALRVLDSGTGVWSTGGAASVGLAATVLGVTLGLGVTALPLLWETSWLALGGGRSGGGMMNPAEISQRRATLAWGVAAGYGPYALEGALLGAAPALALIMRPSPRALRFFLGFVLFLAGAIILAQRAAGM